MKKTLAALIVAATAASANATTIYEKDGTALDIEGSFRLYLGKYSKEERGDLRNNGSRLFFKAKQEIGNGLTALGTAEFRFDKENVDGTIDDTHNTFVNPRLNQLFAGLSHKDVGTITFGRQLTNLDDVQLSDFAYPFGGNNDNNLTTDAEKSIKYRSAEWHGLSIGLDYFFGNANKQSATADLKHGHAVSAFYTRELAKDVTFNFAAAYEQKKQNDNSATSTATGEKSNSWRTAAQLVYGDAALGLEFGRRDYKAQTGETYRRDRFVLVGAQYQVTEPVRAYFQYQNNKKNDVVAPTKKTDNVYIVGVEHKFNSNVLVFVEGYRSITKEPTATVKKYNDTGYGVGMRVFF